MADLDIKTLIAAAEFFYRNGNDVDGMSPAALASLMVDQAAIGTAATLDFDTSTTLAANSNTKIPTQAAVKTYVDDNAGGGSGDVSTTDDDASSWDFVIDEDTMASDLDTKLPTQQSVKAYVDGKASIQSTDTNKLDVYTIGNVTYLDVADLAAGGSAFNDADFLLTNNTSGVQYQFNGSYLYAPAVVFVPGGGTMMLTNGTLEGATVTADGGLYLGQDRTLTVAETYAHLQSLANVTVDFSTGVVRPYIDSFATHTYNKTGEGTAANRFTRARMKITNTTGGTATALGGAQIYDDNCSIVADTKALSSSFYSSYVARPAFSVVNSGTITTGNVWGFIAQQTIGAGVTLAGLDGFNAQPSVTGTVTALRSFVSVPTVNGGGTVTTLTHLRASAYAGTGTVTTQYGVDIGVMTNATTNVGLRNQSTTVLTPTANASITAATATIAHTASIITLTANASYTLTSAPTISDGVDGEELIIINVDTADTITIQDQGTLASSNLRLSANTIALGPRDSIRLVYSSTIGDWVQIGQTNVL